MALGFALEPFSKTALILSSALATFKIRFITSSSLLIIRNVCEFKLPLTNRALCRLGNSIPSAITAAEFIIKSSLFLQVLSVVCLLEPKLGFAIADDLPVKPACTKPNVNVACFIFTLFCYIFSASQ